jgi:hypothetical protein
LEHLVFRKAIPLRGYLDPFEDPEVANYRSMRAYLDGRINGNSQLPPPATTTATGNGRAENSDSATVSNSPSTAQVRVAESKSDDTSNDTGTLLLQHYMHVMT